MTSSSHQCTELVHGLGQDTGNNCLILSTSKDLNVGLLNLDQTLHDELLYVVGVVRTFAVGSKALSCLPLQLLQEIKANET